MSNTFPPTLVAYEIALERSLRMLRASGNPDCPDPQPDDIADAFFQKIPPGTFATDWVHRADPLPDGPSAPSDAPPSPDDTTPDLF